MGRSTAISEERVLCTLFGDGCQRAVARAHKSVRRQDQNLFPHVSAGVFKVRSCSAHGTGEDRVPNDGHMWRIFRPVPDKIGHTVIGVTWGEPIRNPQASNMDAIVAPVLVLWRCAGRIRVKAYLGILGS